MNPMLKDNRQCVQIKYTFKVNSPHYLSDELLVWPAQENYVKHSSSEIILHLTLCCHQRGTVSKNNQTHMVNWLWL